MNLDKELAAMQKYRERSWPRLIKRLRKHIDDHASIELKRRGFHDFKLAHLPFLFNIDLEGITNTELSKRACITKQGMSKIVTELTTLGYITTEKHIEDARSSIIYLSTKGKKLVVEGKTCMTELSAKYASFLGKKNYEFMVDMLIQILDFHENPRKR
jgi:DNA-binding MarR family transcriptional regulator